MFARITAYLEPLNQRARVHREANEAAREAALIAELKFWTAEAAKADPRSDYWHECMDQLDTVKTLMRAS